MNVFHEAILTSEHRVKEWVKALGMHSSETPKEKEITVRLFTHLQDEWTRHKEAVRKYFSWASEHEISLTGLEKMLKGRQRRVESLIDDLRKMTAEDMCWLGKMARLQSLVNDELEFEKREIIPKIGAALRPEDDLYHGNHGIGLR